MKKTGKKRHNHPGRLVSAITALLLAINIGAPTCKTALAAVKTEQTPPSSGAPLSSGALPSSEALPSSGARPASGANTVWQDLYIAEIAKRIDQIFGYAELEIGLVDINNNGTPEMIMTVYTREANWNYHWDEFFCISNGTVLSGDTLAGMGSVADRYKWMKDKQTGAEALYYYVDWEPDNELIWTLGMFTTDPRGFQFQQIYSFSGYDGTCYRVSGNNWTEIPWQQYEQETRAFLANLEEIPIHRSARLSGSNTLAGARQFFEEYTAGSAPTLPYPQPTLTEAQIRAISDALAAQLGGEITSFYKLADDLYYVIISINGQVIGGAVVREGRRGGAIVFHVEYADAELLTEAQLTPYISSAASAPNVYIDYGEVSRFTTAEEYSDYLINAIRDVDGTAPNDAAIHDIAGYIQTAISSQAVTTLTATGNQLVIAGADIEQAARGALQNYDGLMGILQDNNISLGRPVTITVRIEGRNLDPGQAMQITLDNTLSATLGESSIMLLLGDVRHAITVSGASLQEFMNNLGTVSIQIQQNSPGAYKVEFTDSNGNTIDRLPAPVAVTLPATSIYDTVFANLDSGLENWGGQYDSVAGTIQFSTPFSGTYEVMENLYDIQDIASFNDEMKKAINFMVSKGFFELNNGAFEPGGLLDRYEYSTTLVRMFFALDRSLGTSFTDVPPGSGYYSYIASGEYEGLIEGVGGSLFDGERIMNRQEAVTVAARALANKKGYSYPSDPYKYLSSYGDANDIADWAHSPVSLAAREGLVGTGGSFAPRRDITRAEAATILYRLFMLLYETPPVAVEMGTNSTGADSGGKGGNAGSTGGVEDDGSSPDDDALDDRGRRDWVIEPEYVPSKWPLILFCAGVVVVAGAITVVIILLVKRHKKQPGQTDMAPPTGAPDYTMYAPHPETAGNTFCPHCGRELPASAMFCVHCGMDTGKNNY